MDIGGKIKAARHNAGLTQEQAAESLGVSRQTMSNWENGKTYPDIVNVVKMSDLYNISLDCLLKEEKVVSEYVEYLDESTNAVKSKKKLSVIIVSAFFLAVWTFSILVFWLFSGGSDAMGFGIAFLWVLLPAVTFFTSLFIAKDNLFGKAWWAASGVLGVMYMLAEYATFSAANMISFGKINAPQFGMLPAGILISLAGMLTGFAAAKIGKRIRQRRSVKE